MSRNTDIADNIKTTVLELVADLKNGIFETPQEQGDIAIVEFFFSRLHTDDIAQHIVSHVLPHKSHIVARNTEFFMAKKNEIFRGLPEERVFHFAELIRRDETNGGLNDDNRRIIWEYFDTLVCLAEAFKKRS